MLETTFLLTKEDYYAFQESHIRHSKHFKKVLLLQQIAIPLLCLLLIVISLFTVGYNGSFVSAYVLLAVLWFLFSPLLQTRMAIRQAKKTIDRSNLSSILGQYHLTFDKTVICSSHRSGTSQIPLSALIGFTQTNDYIFLYNTSISAFILPLSKLGPQSTAIVEFITTTIPPAEPI